MFENLTLGENVDASGNSTFMVAQMMNPGFGLCYALTPDPQNIKFGNSDYFRIVFEFEEPIDSAVLHFTSKDDMFGLSFYDLGRTQFSQVSMGHFESFYGEKNIGNFRLGTSTTR